MVLATWVILFAEVTPPPDSTTSTVLQFIGAVGGILGIVALLTLPWTIKKLRVDTRSVEVNTETSVSTAALNHLRAALEEADKTILRITTERQARITTLETQLATLEEQVARLSRSLEEERARSEQERDLHERRVVQLLYDLHSKELEIASLRSGRGGENAK